MSYARVLCRCTDRYSDSNVVIPCRSRVSGTWRQVLYSVADRRCVIVVIRGEGLNAEVPEPAGLDSVLSLSSASDSDLSALRSVQADEGADPELDDPPVTPGFHTGELDDADDRGGGRAPGGRYYVNGGMGQVTLFTFPMDPMIFWAIDAYTKRRVQREADAGVGEEDSPFASLGYPERVAKMVAECVGLVIAEDFDKHPEERIFDWTDPVGLPLNVVIAELIEKRWARQRDRERDMMRARIRARWPDATDQDLDRVFGRGGEQRG